MKNLYYSPLRYPGGKGKIAGLMQSVLSENGLLGGNYVESFAGGASIAMFLLLNGFVSDVYINDADKAIYAFWHSILNDTDNLCKKISETAISMEEWYKQRDIQRMKNEEEDLLKLGFSTFFLNRTNRSGIIKGGVIGGLEQTGKYKIDARYNKKELLERINNIAQHSDKIHLTFKDARDHITTLKKELGGNTLFYFDPPYVKQGRGLYMNFYRHDDHQCIADEICGIKEQKWIVTYDMDILIKRLYGRFRHRILSLNYSASIHKKMQNEYMIFSDNLRIPKNALLRYDDETDIL